MPTIRLGRIVSALVVAGLVLLLIPLGVFAGHTVTVGQYHLTANPTDPAFVFGREGGNIRPYSVTIANNGHVSVGGAAPGAAIRTSISGPAIKAVLKLAEAERFFSLPKYVGSLTGPANPEAASLYISIQTTAGTKKVSLIQGHSVPFNQMFSVLSLLVGATQ